MGREGKEAGLLCPVICLGCLLSENGKQTAGGPGSEAVPQPWQGEVLAGWLVSTAAAGRNLPDSKLSPTGAISVNNKQQSLELVCDPPLETPVLPPREEGNGSTEQQGPAPSFQSPFTSSGVSFVVGRAASSPGAVSPLALPTAGTKGSLGHGTCGRSCCPWVHSGARAAWLPDSLPSSLSGGSSFLLPPL